jgi:hypothetical protein
MHLKINASSEFKQLLSQLSDDRVYANVYLKLFKDLNAATAEYVVEFNQAVAFWRLTFSAHWDACVIRLCRAYDMNPDSLAIKQIYSSRP